MSVEKFIANALRIAQDDLEAARALVALSNRNAVYHYEQAAEKIIRAVLTSEQKNAGPRHMLDEMVSLIPDVNPFKATLRGIQDLSVYATSYRYPTQAGRIPSPPSGQELAAFSLKVEAALATAASRFGVDLTRKDLPAQNPQPIR